jgi:formylglycine-generating enzyme required for sulfatase activity
MALAAFDFGSDQWTMDDARLIVDQLLASSRDEQKDLRNLLRDLGEWLLPPLTARFRDPHARPTVRTAAADALAEFAVVKPDLLAELVSEADPEQYDVLHTALGRSQQIQGAARPTLLDLACETPRELADEKDRVRIGRRRAGAAIELASLGMHDLPSSLFETRGDPEALTQLIHRLRDRRLPVEVLLHALPEVKATEGRFTMLLALGEFGIADVPEPSRTALKDQLATWYGDDPSSSIHSACGWLLRQWGFDEAAQKVEETPVPYHPDREWFIEKIGEDFFTFIVFKPQAFPMGSPEEESFRRKNEHRHKVQITRPFAISDREVSRGVFERLGVNPLSPTPDPDEATPSAEHPIVGVRWAEAVQCCRELTARAGLSVEQQCYLAPVTGEKDPNWLFRPDRHGYRLPTEAEWELACRAGTTTPYSFGSDQKLLDHYGRHLSTTALAAGRLRPNLRGLFDTYGNAMEWCQDWYEDRLMDGAVDPVGPEKGLTKVLRGGSWESSGWQCRSAARFQATPDTHDSAIGFRIVKTLP